MKRDDWGKLALTSVLGVALSYAFVFLAALPLRYQRLYFGRRLFLTSTLACTGTLVAFGLWQWAVVYLSLSALIGLYREMEECHTSIFTSALIAVSTTALVSGFATVAYTRWLGLNFKNLLQEKATPFLEQMQKLPRFQDSNVDLVLWYLPAAVIVTLMLVLFVSLTFSRLPGDMRERTRLLVFQLPDWAIWVFIGSLAATFIPESNSALSLAGTNVLTVVLAAYFFQGLAVVTVFMDRLHIFGFLRLIAYFLIFFQMFIVVSGVGILDFWFDFRSLTTRKLQKTQ